MGEVVPFGLWTPTTYCPTLDSEWLTYQKWRKVYYRIIGLNPSHYANLDGDIFYVYFLSQIDSRLSDDKTRIMSAEIGMNMDTLFINQLYYHMTVLKKEIVGGWEDIKEELFYEQDRQYMSNLYSNEDVMYADSFIDYQSFMDYLTSNFDEIFVYGVVR